MDGKENVHNGVSHSKFAMERFGSISGNFRDLQKQIDSISPSILKLSDSSEDVNVDVQNLSVLISESNINADSLTDSSKNLADLSIRLNSIVDVFNTTQESFE